MNRFQHQDYELHHVINTFIEIGNSLSKQSNSQKNSNFKYAEGLAQKTINHALTVNYLFGGYQYKTETESYAPQVDFSSMCILTRACLEAYLTFNYLFIAPKTEIEKEFKFLCWDLGGYIDRENFPADTSRKFQLLKEAEKEEIKRLKKLIISHSYLNPGQEKQKELALKGQWRLKNSWSKIAVNAGFKEDFFDNIYGFLCGHSHSSRLSVIQVQQTKDINIQQEASMATINLLKMILSKFIFEYANLIPELKKDINFESDAYNRILVYKKFAENMNLSETK